MANLGKRRDRIGAAPAFELQERERHRGEQGMMVPARITAAFEVIESQLALQIAILHLDRPPAARDADQGLQRRVRRQVADGILPIAVDERFLAQQPPLAATLRDAHAHGGEPRFEWTLRAPSPPKAMP